MRRSVSGTSRAPRSPAGAAPRPRDGCRRGSAATATRSSPPGIPLRRRAGGGAHPWRGTRPGGASGAEAGEQPVSLPALPWLDDLLGLVPAGGLKLVAFMPSTSRRSRVRAAVRGGREAACKAQVAEIARRHGATLVDFRIPSAVTRDDTLYWDALHYRLPIAARIVARLEAGGGGAARRSGRVLSRARRPARHDEVGAPSRPRARRCRRSKKPGGTGGPEATPVGAGSGKAVGLAYRARAMQNPPPRAAPASSASAGTAPAHPWPWRRNGAPARSCPRGHCGGASSRAPSRDRRAPRSPAAPGCGARRPAPRRCRGGTTAPPAG